MARTLSDIQLARLLYPLLIELVTARQNRTYGQLIEMVKPDSLMTNTLPT